MPGGPVTDEQALIDALNDGSIFGAGLDVLDPEPADPSNPLLDMANIVVLPHIAPVGTPADRMQGFVLDNLVRLDEGRPLVGKYTSDPHRNSILRDVPERLLGIAAVVNAPGHSDGIFKMSTAQMAEARL